MMATRVVGVALVTTSLALTLGGCRYYWFKPGSTAEMFGRDSEACLADARAASPTTQKYGIVNEQVYRACLASRGYERQKTTSAADKHRGYEFDD